MRTANPRSRALLTGLLAVLAACREPAPVVDEATRSFRLQVENIIARPIDGAVPSAAAVREGLATAAARRASFQVDAAAATLVTDVAVGEVESAAGGRILRVEFTAAVPAGLQALLGAELDATIELERNDGTLSAAEDLPVALARGVGVLDAKLQLATGAMAQAKALLDDEDPEIVVLALEHIARKRWRSLAADVAARLPSTDERVAAAAIEALGAVGGPEHTATLLRHTRLADRDQAERLYEALATLGGDQARGFLEFAARNEDDPGLAEVAQRALRRLQRAGEPLGEVVAEGTAGAPEGRGLRGHRP